MSTPQMPPAAPKKASPILFIIIGIVGFLFLLGILGAFGVWYAVHKVKEVAGSPSGVIKTVLAMNPNVDVVSTDDSAGTVTIRDKKTGKTVTMNFDDVKNGKWTIKEDGKDAVTVETKSNGDASGIVVKSSEGTVQFGGSDLKLPSWLPAYPGSSPKVLASTNKDGAARTMFVFTTKDSPEKAGQFYADALKAAGLKVESNAVPGGSMSVTARDGEKKFAQVSLVNTGETTVSVEFHYSQ